MQEQNMLSVIGADSIHTEDDDPLRILLANGPSQSFRQTRVQSFNSHQWSRSAFKATQNTRVQAY